ncbi:MAG: hypothetical protein HY033_09860 [Ignavibacteriae bacterium]|nr:hypothetical protein [Ignavibacteria bacterium]MBI3365200.1 hypothetical protein [Ignavibacteriota bacterium]
MPDYVKLKRVHPEDAIVIPHSIFRDREFNELHWVYGKLVLATIDARSNPITFPITKELLSSVRWRSYKRLVRMVEKLDQDHWIEIVRTHFTEDGKKIAGWNVKVKVISPYSGKLEE